jgi:hypothetical protein
MSDELRFETKDGFCVQFRKWNGGLDITVNGFDFSEGIGIWIPRNDKQKLREWLDEPTGESEADRGLLLGHFVDDWEAKTETFIPNPKLGESEVSK